MRVRNLVVKDYNGNAMLTAVVGSPVSDLDKAFFDIQNGKAYELILRPIRSPKTNDQCSAIWAKIQVIAKYLETSADEVYLTLLERYGTSIAMRTKTECVKSISENYRLVKSSKPREDGTVFLKAWKGLSQMNTEEASRLLDGVLSELREMGLPAEVDNGSWNKD